VSLFEAWLMLSFRPSLRHSYRRTLRSIFGVACMLCCLGPTLLVRPRSDVELSARDRQAVKDGRKVTVEQRSPPKPQEPQRSRDGKGFPITKFPHMVRRQEVRR